MKKACAYIIMILSLSCTVDLKGQNFIGIHKDAIPGLLKTAYPQFKLDKSAVNHNFTYLKFVDKISEQTLLFFLSDKGICTYVRWIADYSNLNDMITMLNENYHKTGSNIWTYSDKGVAYTVTLVEDEWYFTVSFRKN
jgi:hypothetical protein